MHFVWKWTPSLLCVLLFFFQTTHSHCLSTPAFFLYHFLDYALAPPHWRHSGTEALGLQVVPPSHIGQQRYLSSSFWKCLQRMDWLGFGEVKGEDHYDDLHLWPFGIIKTVYHWIFSTSIIDYILVRGERSRSQWPYIHVNGFYQKPTDGISRLGFVCSRQAGGSR